MIRADGPAKVKQSCLLAWGFAAAVAATLSFSFTIAKADVSENDVRTLEEQEFGIESPSKTKKKTQPSENADKVDSSVPEDVQSEALPERVKPIEAEEFNTKALKKSRSGRVILFEDNGENKPRPGKILLLKNAQDEIAAVRVLKNYPGKFAAKVVLSFKQADVGQEYRALKKLGDKIIAMIKEREKRGKDLDAVKTDEDLALEVAPDDNELDRGIPAPKPQQSKKKPKAGLNDGAATKKSQMPEPLFSKDGDELESGDDFEIKNEDEPMSEVSVNEQTPLEPSRHAVSVQYAQIRSIDKKNDPAQYSGIGIRYGYNIWKNVFLKRKTLQDMITAEASLFYYSISGFILPEDTVKVIPMIGTVRYCLLVGENLTFFGYAGFIRNNVSTSDSALSNQTTILATTKPALGAGTMIKIGPSWAARLDFGTDLFGIGAVLKF